MELIDTLSRLAARIDSQRPLLTTEEATKNALVMPLINALGYNVFDPSEVVPEFTADVGTKKGEKVDYLIRVGGKPMILIECKTLGSKLSLNHASQLYRYFSVTEARFGILTDGIVYWVYTDLDSPNKMDEKPFFEFRLDEINERSVTELQKFAKSSFDLDNILANAGEMKYAKQIKRLIEQEYEQPSEELVRLFAGKVYDGQLRSAVRDQFTKLVRTAFRDFVREKVKDRLESALSGTSAADVDVDAEVEEETPAESADGVVTTPEEIEAFHVVRAILSRHIDPERVVMRDTKSYCGVLLDDNNRKPICRLRFNSSQKYLSLMDEQKAEQRTAIEKPSDIYQHADALVAAVRRYDGVAGGDTPSDSDSTGN